MTKQLAPTRIETLRDMLEKAAPRLQEVAPRHLKVDRLVRLLLSAASRTPKILECSPTSVLQFAMKCSETGLEPIGPGGCWAIPFENRKANTVELQFIPDYRGLVHSAKRAGCIKDAWPEVVRERDEFNYELGLSASLTHKPARGDRGELEAVYCVIVMPDGAMRFIVMDRGEVEQIRKRSRAANSGPWVTDPGEMWKKTVVRRAMKQFGGASPCLYAGLVAYDAAHGLVDLREPVPLPRALGEEAPVPEGDGNGQAPQEEPKASEETILQLEDEIARLDLNQKYVRAACESVGARGMATLRQGQAEELLKKLRGEPTPGA